MTAPKQHVILCEGYDDRSFWKGWLLHLGCVDSQPPVRDAWGDPVTGGSYLFRTKAGTDVLAKPYASLSNLGAAAEQFLQIHRTKPLGRLILNLDCDTELDTADKARAKVQGIMDRLGGTETGNGGYDVSGVQVFPVFWECRDAKAPGIPGKQTLERLASAALCAAYPGRGKAVADWLEAEPHGGIGHKNHSLSYFAKWYAADHGSGFFYEALWKDEAVAAELRSRLEATGAWQIVEDLVAD